MRPLIIIALICFTSAAWATGDLPDPKLTPGDTLPGVTAQDVCIPGWAKQHRDVSSEVRRQMFTSYGLPGGNRTGYCDGPEGCELDHLIPLSIGGSNSAKNLWPQPYGGMAMSAKAKDKLENKLHALVCSGKLPLAAAQRAIAENWVEAHRRFVQGARE